MRLPRIHNMNVMMYVAHEAVWDTLEPDARVIHYGVSRPGLDVIGFGGIEVPRKTIGPWSIVAVWPLGFLRAYEEMLADHPFMLSPI